MRFSSKVLLKHAIVYTVCSSLVFTVPFVPVANAQLFGGPSGGGEAANPLGNLFKDIMPAEPQKPTEPAQPSKPAKPKVVEERSIDDVRQSDLQQFAATAQAYSDELADLVSDQRPGSIADLIDHVGSDPGDISAWISDNISSVPYRGMLRSNLTVLRSGKGNSADKATLLSSILNELGYETKLRRHQLTKEAAERILLEIADTAFAPSYTADVFLQARDAVRRYANDIADTAETVHASRDYDLLSNITQQATELQDYWLVLCRIDGEWIELDPFGAVVGPDDYVETDEFREIPDSERHLLDVSLALKVHSNGVVKEEEIFKITSNSAEIDQSDIAISFRPVGVPSRAISDLIQTKAWLPIVTVGGRTSESKLFTFSGEVEPATEQSLKRYQGQGSPMGGIEEGMAEAVESLGSILNNALDRAKGQDRPSTRAGIDKPTSDSIRALTLRIRSRSPGEPERTFERAILSDQVRPAGETDRADVLDLLNFRKLSFQTGLLDDVGFAQSISSQLSTINIAILSSDELAQKMDAVAAVESDFATFSYLRAALSPARQQAFIGTPNLLIQHVELDELAEVEDWSAKVSIDIVDNATSMMIADTDPFYANVAQGVADTLAEAIIIAGDRDHNMALRHNALAEDVISLSAYGEKRESDDEAIIRNLEAGFVVVVANGAKVSAKPELWWRVDPLTGKTLGVHRDGYGQAALEYLMTTIMNPWFLLGFTLDSVFMYDCMTQRSLSSSVFGDSKDEAFGLLIDGVDLSDSSSLERTTLCTIDSYGLHFLALFKIIKTIGRLAKYLPKLINRVPNLPGVSNVVKAGDDVADVGGDVLRRADDAADTGGDLIRRSDDAADSPASAAKGVTPTKPLSEMSPSDLDQFFRRLMDDTIETGKRAAERGDRRFFEDYGLTSGDISRIVNRTGNWRSSVGNYVHKAFPGRLKDTFPGSFRDVTRSWEDYKEVDPKRFRGFIPDLVMNDGPLQNFWIDITTIGEWGPKARRFARDGETLMKSGPRRGVGYDRLYPIIYKW